MLKKRERFHMYRRFGKRVIDIILSFTGIILLSPLLLLIAAWIKLDSKGPVMFSQKRIGRNKSYFNILKFRTMHVDAPKDVPTHLLNDPHTHITRCGHFLRKTSLDELPQLLNIFVGQMSIVGPRPALWNQDDLIHAREKYGANDVRPGLTGWAQINGRDELDILTKAYRDGEYVNRITMKADFICLISTFVAVIRKRGIIEGRTGSLIKQNNEVIQKVVANK